MCKLLSQTCYYIATLAFLSLPQLSIVTGFGFFACLFFLMNLSATAEKGEHNLTNKEKPHRLRQFATRSVQNSSPASFSHLFRPNKHLCYDCF